MKDFPPIRTRRSHWFSNFFRRPPLRSLLRGLHWQRVPILVQLNAVECGAACLAMILTFHGRRTGVAECREHCGVGRDGLTAQTIAKAAEYYGLRVKAYSSEPHDIQYIRLPAIAHWNFHHFVVVESWSRKSVVIVDPAVGRRHLTANEFDAGFTGVILTFEPGVHFTRRRSADAPSWSRYLREILRVPGIVSALLQIFGASLLIQSLGLAFPVITKIIIDDMLPLHIDSILTLLGLGMILLFLAQMVTYYLRAMLLLYLHAHLDSQLMMGFLEHLLTLPFRFFQERTSGDLLMRLGSNSVIRETLTSQTIAIVLDGAFVLIYLAILVFNAPMFGIFAFCIGLIQIVLILATTQQMKLLMNRDLLTQAESQSYLVEALIGIATLKASGSEDRVLNHWSNLFFKHLNIALQRNHLSAMIDTLLMGVRICSPLFLLWVGALQVLNGTLTLGMMLALNILAAAFLMPLASLVSTLQQLQLAGAHLERLIDIIEAAPEQDVHAAQPAPRLTGKIDLCQVSFRYNANGPHALHEITFSIEPGQKVALVGRTGSGKSTLAMLLLGLYTPTGGEICYDGISLQRIDYRSLRQQCGVVLQEPALFSGSIRENIVQNNPHCSFEAIMWSAQQAVIHDDIMRMPMGYDTLIAEGGNALSGGQRQRLAIARALVHKPALLVLDEATSHLDVLTEQIVDQNLSTLSCTRIVIAHRLSTIRNADRILVLNNGTVVEQGTHEELLARQGQYAALICNQLETTESAPPPATALFNKQHRYQNAMEPEQDHPSGLLI